MYATKMKSIIFGGALVMGGLMATPVFAYNVGGSPNGTTVVSGVGRIMAPGLTYIMGGVGGGCGRFQLTVQVTGGVAQVIDADMVVNGSCVRLIPNGLPWPIDPATGPGYTPVPLSTTINPGNPLNNVRITGVSITNPIFGVICTGAINKADLDSTGLFWFNQTLGVPSMCSFNASAMTSSPPWLPLP